MSTAPAQPVAPETVAGDWVAIGLGANLGPREQTLEAAIAAIAALPQTRLVARSSLYRSAPVQASGPDYCNAVAAVRTRLAPLALLAALQAVENAHGRQRPWPNAPRTLDLDILLWEGKTIARPELTVPHPRMEGRAFVLLPLAEIAPARVSARQLRAVAAQAVEKMPGPLASGAGPA